jgi:hypothetical protein
MPIDTQQDVPTQGQQMGLVLVQSGDDLNRQDEMRKEAEKKQHQPIITNLAAYVRTVWERNKRAKESIERELLRDMRQLNGEYDPDVLAKIEAQKQPPIYMMVTSIKAFAAKSWLKDIMLLSGERPFNLDPTPIPDLPEGVRQKAAAQLQQAFMQLQAMRQDAPQTQEEAEKVMLQAAEKMRETLLKKLKEKADEDAETLTDEVDDDLTEGGWYQMLHRFIDDIVDKKTAFVMGPIPKKKKVLEWATDEEGGAHPMIVEKVVDSWENPDGLDVYPSPGMKDLQNGDLIVRIRFTRKELNEMIGTPGFDENAIRLVLWDYGQGGLREWLSTDSERNAILDSTDDNSGNPDHKIDCLKMWASIQGRMLLEYGMTPEQVPDPDLDYEAVVYLIGNHVIGARLNSHPLKKRNIYGTSFRPKNGSIWGDGVPGVMRDIQTMCNAAARAMARNMSIASGPQVGYNVSRLPPGANITNIYPWKIWQFTDSEVNTNTPPMMFFQPNMHVDELLKVYQYWYDQASEVTGIPAYVYGSADVGGAGETASGLSMLMNSAAKGLKSVAQNIDMYCITPTVEEAWLQIMLYNPKKARGDIKVVARASAYLLVMEQLMVRRNEFLQLTNNPTDMAIIGNQGRAEILRETVKTLKIPVDRVVPDRESIEQQTKQQELQNIAQNISQALGVPPEQAMAMMMGQQAALQAPGGGQ